MTAAAQALLMAPGAGFPVRGENGEGWGIAARGAAGGAARGQGGITAHDRGSGLGCRDDLPGVASLCWAGIDLYPTHEGRIISPRTSSRVGPRNT
mgnify:CR=1 FL=1